VYALDYVSQGSRVWEEREIRKGKLTVQRSEGAEVPEVSEEDVP
jgi:hypothetical protein